MATKKDTTKCKTTKESKPKKSSKRSKTKPTCNNVTTYQTINVDELAHNNKTIETDKDTTIKEEVNVDNQNEKPIDMLIIHENRKPWSALETSPCSLSYTKKSSNFFPLYPVPCS